MTAAVLFLFLFLALLATPLRAASPRTIPATDGNQGYFETTQALFFYGDRKESSCGAFADEVEACIKSCNSPGLQQRGDCCCTAFPSQEFYVGVRGGCRYRQQLLNFTTTLVYRSVPIPSGPRYFDPVSCTARRKSDSEDPCTCSMRWELAVAALQVASPLASPTPSLTPGLSPTGTPVASPPPSESPVESETPAAPTETPGIETETPGPSPAVITPPTVTVVATPDPTVTPSVVPSESPIDAVTPTPFDPSDMDGSSPSPMDGEGESPSPGLADGDASETPTPSPTSDDDGSVCVEEAHLVRAGVPRAHMIHPVGMRARVLCPPGSLPCGTERHALRVRGVLTSYADFCARHVRCAERTAVVNNVYSHLWQDSEHEDGVSLTMLDIAYPEIPQKAFHAVLRFVHRLRRWTV